MRILIVAATDSEIASLAAHLDEGRKTSPNVKQFKHMQRQIAILTIGVGMVASAA